ncbi:MAG: hypothetical protein JHD02_00560 [Thermoleophilaceae bacterium]|nr:hypothetical protein [Thermoleophilaceae bacterium]
MTAADNEQTRDPSVRKRRLVLYSAAGLAILLVAAFAGRTLLAGDDKPAPPPKVVAPVIVERIQMKPVGGSRARGLAEVLRRGNDESVRVLAAQLKPSAENQVYRLLLTGGPPEDKLLGNSAVGTERIFVGEAKVTVDELHSYKRIEIRAVTNGAPPSEKTVLRGKIPR